MSDSVTTTWNNGFPDRPKNVRPEGCEMTAREEFEKWMSSLPFEWPLMRLGEEYASRKIQLAWESWQDSRKWRPIKTAPKDKTCCLPANTW